MRGTHAVTCRRTPVGWLVLGLGAIGFLHCGPPRGSDWPVDDSTRDSPTAEAPAPELEKDRDGDGYDSQVDCKDRDPDVHPGAPEYCNGADDDCDGEIDEEAVDASTWYTQADDDGLGLDSSAIRACSQPQPYAFLNQEPMTEDLVAGLCSSPQTGQTSFLALLQREIPFRDSLGFGRWMEGSRVDLDADGEAEVLLIVAAAPGPSRHLVVLDRLAGGWRLVHTELLFNWYEPTDLSFVEGVAGRPVIHARDMVGKGTGFYWDRNRFFRYAEGSVHEVAAFINRAHDMETLIHPGVSTRFSMEGEALRVVYEYAFGLSGGAGEALDNIGRGAVGLISGEEAVYFVPAADGVNLEPDFSENASSTLGEEQWSCLETLCTGRHAVEAFRVEIARRLLAASAAERCVIGTYLGYVDEEQILVQFPLDRWGEPVECAAFVGTSEGADQVGSIGPVGR